MTLTMSIICNAATEIWKATAAGSSGDKNVTAYQKGTTNTTTEPFQGSANYYFNTGGNPNGNWEGDSYYMYIAPAAFQNVELKAGQKIVLSLNYTQSESKVYLRNPGKLKEGQSDNNYPENWDKITDESVSTSTWAYTLTDGDITNIKSHGLGIGGYYINFNAVAVADADESTDPPAPESVKGFHINGTHLVDAKGNDFLIRGYNYSYAWQSDWKFGPIDKAKEVGCNAIRLNLGNGTRFSYTDYNTLVSLISHCEQQKLVCIPEIQDPLGSNSIDELDKAVNYWISMKGALIGHENTVIINIANEWVEGWAEQADTWRNGYVKAIKALRGAGLKHTIMIDCAGYGQYPDVIWTHGQDIIDADKEANGGEANIMFSIHFYEHACYEDFFTPSGSRVAWAMDKALAMNVPLCVGEFGYARKGGKWHCDWETILKYGKTHNVGYLGWSHHGNGEGDDCLDMFYSNGSLTYNGQCIIETPEYGIKATSVECTVFNNTPENSIKFKDYTAGTPSGDAEQYLDGLIYTKIGSKELTYDELINAGAMAGRKLRVMCANANETAYTTLYIKKGDCNTAFIDEYKEKTAIAGYNYFDITLTTAMLDALKAGDELVIGGQGYDIEGVYVIKPEHAYADATTMTYVKAENTTVHTFTNDSWDKDGNEHYIKGTNGDANSIFKDVQAGDIVVVKYNNVNSGAQMSIKDGAHYKKDGKVYYSWIDSDVDYMDVGGDSYSFTVKDEARGFTEYNQPAANGTEMVKSLRENGLRINGKALTITSVTVKGTKDVGLELNGNTTINRKLTPEQWRPISLPFAMTETEISTVFGTGTKVAELGASTKDDANKTVKVTMNEVSSIEPNKPYIIKAGTTAEKYEFNGVTLSPAQFASTTMTTKDGNVSFVSTAPVYVDDTASEMCILPKGAYYFWTDGKIYQSAKDRNIKAGLAYFIINAELRAKGYTLFMGDNETTGIEIINDIKTQTNRIYSIEGKYLGTDIDLLPSGIYIVNGRKVVK